MPAVQLDVDGFTANRIKIEDTLYKSRITNEDIMTEKEMST